MAFTVAGPTEGLHFRQAFQRPVLTQTLLPQQLSSHEALPCHTGSTLCLLHAGMGRIAFIDALLLGNDLKGSTFLLQLLVIDPVSLEDSLSSTG